MSSSHGVHARSASAKLGGRRWLGVLAMWTLALPSIASGDDIPQRADPDETKRAVTYARELRTQVELIQAKDGVFPDDLVREISDLYFYGMGRENAPGDPVVARKFARPWVLALYTEVFGVNKTGDSAQKRLLTPRSAVRLRTELARFLKGAPKELNAPNRSQLYRLSREVLCVSDKSAIDALDSLSNDTDLDPKERAEIRTVLEAVTARPEPPPLPAPKCDTQ